MIQQTTIKFSVQEIENILDKVLKNKGINKQMDHISISRWGVKVFLK